MKIEKCLNCNTEFNKKHKNHKFCCNKCKSQYKYNNFKPIILNCDNCNKEIERRRVREYQHAFCSLECELDFKHKESWEFRNCEICGDEFECKKIKTQRFCSSQCQSKWQSIELVGEKANNYNHNYSIEDRTLSCEWCETSFKVIPYKIDNARFCSDECRRLYHSKVYSQSEEWKEESRKRTCEMLESGIIPQTMTKPHIAICEILDVLGIKYITEKSFTRCVVDIYLLESNLIIEIMGGFWHADNRDYDTINYTQQKTRIVMDKIKHSYILNNHNINILYLWENDINKNLQLCENLIIDYINNLGVLNNYHSFNYDLINNNIKIKQELITPYMEWESDELNKIVDLTVKEKMCKKQLDKWTVFNCDVCGKEREEYTIRYNKKQNHYCSVECSNIAITTKINTNCSYCNSEISVIKSKFEKNKYIFCNQECQHSFQREFGFKRNSVTIDFQCEKCGKSSTQNKWDYNKSKHHFCSKECYYKYKIK